jgi:hypothetical protein
MKRNIWSSIDVRGNQYFLELLKKLLKRPKLTWLEGIRELMGEKGLMEEDWNGRNNWRKKII